METDENLGKEQNSSKEQEKPKKTKSALGKLKEGLKAVAPIAMAILLFTIGGPIGIALGILALLFAARKPISKLAEKAYKSVAEKIVAKKKVKKGKLKTIKKGKTGSLEMDAASLKEMKTRSNSISKIDLIPAERAKSTSNGLQPNALKFQGLIKPSIELSEKATKLRNHPALAKRNSLPNIKSVRPTL